MQALHENVRRNAKLIPETASTVTPASAVEPRMLLTSTDVNRNVFALTISGSMTDPDALLVEIAESVRPPAEPPPFNQAKIIKFNEATGAPPEFIEDPLRYFKGHVTKDCTTCHGENLRWVWNGQYNGWRGAYGSVHKQGGYLGVTVEGEEVENIRRFREFAADHPIYRYLPQETITYENLSHANTNFNIDLGHANGQRMLETLRRHPEARRFDALIVQAFVDAGSYRHLETGEIVERLLSPDFLQFVPIQDRAAYIRQVPNLAAKTLRDIQAFERYLANAPGAPFPVHAYETPLATNYAVFRFICERLGIDMSDWSLPLNRNYLGFNDGDHGGAIRRAERPFIKQVVFARHADLVDESLLHSGRVEGNRREPFLQELFRRTNPAAGNISAENIVAARYLDHFVQRVRANQTDNMFAQAVNLQLGLRLDPTFNARFPAYTLPEDIKKIAELLGYLTQHVFTAGPEQDETLVVRVAPEELAKILKLIPENPRLDLAAKAELIGTYLAKLPDQELADNFLRHLPLLDLALEAHRKHPNSPKITATIDRLRDFLHGPARTAEAAAEAARLAFAANPEFALRTQPSQALRSFFSLCHSAWASLRR